MSLTMAARVSWPHEHGFWALETLDKIQKGPLMVPGNAVGSMSQLYEQSWNMAVVLPIG